MAATKTTGRRMPDAYFALIVEFPLAPLRHDDDLRAAQAMVDRLLQEALDEGGGAYLEVLSDLIVSYEEEKHPIPDASEADVLRLLLEANGLTQASLAKTVGISASTISSVLKGTRSLTKQQMLKLAKHFDVNPSVFLPAPG